MENQHNLDSVVQASPLLSLHRSLCETEGLSNHEQSVGDFLTSYLNAHNFTVEKQVVPFDDDSDGAGPPRFNVYAYPAWQPATAGPEIILTSHIDTVPPHIPYSLSRPGSSRREDILLSGRGTVDAKACVAAQTRAAETYLSSDPDARLGLLFVVSEETSGSGMTFFSGSDLNTPYPSKRGGGADAGGYHTVIFGEPTEHALASGHKGALGFQLSVHGTAAHSGYPWLGRSAISRILPILKALDGLGVTPENEGGLPRNEKYGNSTVNIGVMSGGAASNVVPALAEAEGTIRVAGGAIGEVRKLVERAVLGDGGDNNNDDVKLAMHGDYYAPIDLDADVEGFEAKSVNYGTDVPYLDVTRGHDDGQSQVKRYLYGPGTIHVAHGEDEALTIGDLEKGYEGYLSLIDAAVKRGKELKR